MVVIFFISSERGLLCKYWGNIVNLSTLNLIDMKLYIGVIVREENEKQGSGMQCINILNLEFNA